MTDKFSSSVVSDEIDIKSVGVPYGWPKSRQRIEPGYVLENGIVLLESERDENGNYIGGAGMDGMYLRAPYPNHLFSPVCKENGEIHAFRRVEIVKDKTHTKGGQPMSSMKSAAKDVEFESLDSIFKPREVVEGEQIINIPLTELHPFKGHPFQVRDDEAMQDLTESIQKAGVYTPAIVRPREEGGYELIAGHRRAHACELAGKDILPVVVRNLDDDAATILMCDTNLQQRDSILPSERAFAYKLKLDAMKHQGERADLTSSPLGMKLNRTQSLDVLGEQEGQSRNQIHRYIRLTELVPPLLELVDSGKVAFRPAVELSYLKKEEQTTLLDLMDAEQSTPSLAQAQRLKQFSQKGMLSENSMLAIMTEEKDAPEKVTFTGERLKKYFPRDTTPKQMEDTIIKLLEQWKTRQRNQER